MPRGRPETSEPRFPESPADRALGIEAALADKEWREAQDSMGEVKRIIAALKEQVEETKLRLARAPRDATLIADLAEALSLLRTYQQGMDDLVERSQASIDRDLDVTETRSLIERRTAPGGKA